MSDLSVPRPSDSDAPGVPETLVVDIRRLITDARAGVAATVNAGLTLLFWQAGQRIRVELPAGERASYSDQIVATVAVALTREYGPSFGEKNPRNMLRFAEVYPDREIVYALRRQLRWTHFTTLSTRMAAREGG